MIRIFLPCTGLGRQQRGFETFTREVAGALQNERELEISVFKGGGASTDRERTVWNFRRDGDEAAALASMIGRTPYFVEQSSFFLGFLPHLLRGRPDIVYFADINLGNALWHWRRISGQKYKLLFYNGAGTPDGFIRADLVQRLTPRCGPESRLNEVLLPHGVSIAAATTFLFPEQRRQNAARLGLPVDRPIAISVGLIDKKIKRMDYVIEEIASMSQLPPFLLILGQRCDESAEIEALALARLGKDGFAIRTVPREQIGEYYEIADLFVLASLKEGFGLVYVEALSHGLPVLAHDFSVTRYILGEEASSLADLSRTGALKGVLERLLREPKSEAARQRRHASVYERFSWEKLRPQYVKMFERCMTVDGEHR